MNNINLNSSIWRRLAKAITCGHCGNETTINSEFTCTTCGRTLCANCGNRWGWCKDHIPSCVHPELMPTNWMRERPEVAIMIGSCQHNMTCPICGYGWGSMPDPCKQSDEK